MLRSSRPSSTAEVRPTVSHVSVPGDARSRAGIKVHRSRTLSASDVTRRSGIPVTTPSRTLTDLRRILPKPQFAAALRQAEYLQLPIDRSLEPDHTRSELEARFLALCRRHRLPKPEVNVSVGEFTVDFLWHERRLIVELDGYRAHAGRASFDADRGRDLRLKQLGFEVVRLTWRQLNDPAVLAATIRHLRSGRAD
jgi:very-short-patch-repair endonuclease